MAANTEPTEQAQWRQRMERLPKAWHSRKQWDLGLLERQLLQGMCGRCWNRHHKSLLALLEFGGLAASKEHVTTLLQCLPTKRAI